MKDDLSISDFGFRQEWFPYKARTVTKVLDLLVHPEHYNLQHSPTSSSEKYTLYILGRRTKYVQTECNQKRQDTNSHGAKFHTCYKIL